MLSATAKELIQSCDVLAITEALLPYPYSEILNVGNQNQTTLRTLVVNV